MRHLKEFYSFSKSIFETLRDPYEDYGEETPTDPYKEYPDKECLFEPVLDIPTLNYALLKGKPTVGGGYWLLCPIDEIPEEYLYQFYDNSNYDLDDRVGTQSFPSWATDIWKNQKGDIGEGVPGEDEDYKLLTKIDSDLKNSLINELEDSLSYHYINQSNFNRGTKKYFIYPRNQKGNKERIKKALFFLERELD